MPKAKRGCLSSPLGLTTLGILLVVSLFVVSQALPILYAIAFPPVLSLPPGTTLIRQKNYQHGVDEWLYNAPIRSCDMADYLHTLGIQCAGAYGCGQLAPDEPDTYTGMVTQCYGQQSISMFKVQWTVMLNADPSNGMNSTFQVYREMFWGGAIPSKRFADILEEVEVEMTLTAMPLATATTQP